MKSLLVLLAMLSGLAHAKDFTAADKSQVTLTDHDLITFPKELRDGNGDGLITPSRKKVAGFFPFLFDGGVQYLNTSTLKKISGTSYGLKSYVPEVVYTDGKSKNGVILLKKSISNTTLGPLAVTGAFRAIETASGVVLNNVVIDGINAIELQRDGIRLRTANDVTIKNFNLKSHDKLNTSPNLPEGIAISAGKKIVIQDGTIEGFRMVKSGYTNGDGIAIERGASDVTIERVMIIDPSDGGVDLKSTNTKMNDVTVTKAYRAFRVWVDLEAGTLTSIDSGNAVFGNTNAKIHIKKLIVKSETPASVLNLNGKVTITVDECDLTGMAKGSKMLREEAKGNIIKLGKGCTL